jgi:hypothetical protein
VPSRPRDSRVAPATYTTALGRHFVDSLTNAEKFAVLVIGHDRWTRHQLANELGVVHTVAAGRLSAIAKDLGVKDTADLYARTSPYSLTAVEYRAGVTTLYVMFAAFRA